MRKSGGDSDNARRLDEKGKQKYQRQPGYEAADMPPMHIDPRRDRTDLIEKLQKEPVDQIDPSRRVHVVAEYL